MIERRERPAIICTTAGLNCYPTAPSIPPHARIGRGKDDGWHIYLQAINACATPRHPMRPKSASAMPRYDPQTNQFLPICIYDCCYWGYPYDSRRNIVMCMRPAPSPSPTATDLLLQSTTETIQVIIMSTKHGLLLCCHHRIV